VVHADAVVRHDPQLRPELLEERVGHVRVGHGHEHRAVRERRAEDRLEVRVDVAERALVARARAVGGAAVRRRPAEHGDARRRRRRLEALEAVGDVEHALDVGGELRDLAEHGGVSTADAGVLRARQLPGDGEDRLQVRPRRRVEGGVRIGRRAHRGRASKRA